MKKQNKKYKILFLGPGLYLSGYKEIDKIMKKKFSDKIVFRVSNNHKDINRSYSLVISLGYRQIIPKKYLKIPLKGIIIFHSSDLPEGRGWAPLYYALAEKKEKHTLSLIFADEKIDAGNIIAKAKCDIKIYETLESLREKDDFLVIKLIEKYLMKILEKEIKGKKQVGRPTYNKRRFPEASKININEKFKNIYFKLRALDNDAYPGYFSVGGRKFYLKIFPDFKKDKIINYKIIDFLK